MTKKLYFKGYKVPVYVKTGFKTQGEVFSSENRGTNATRSETKQVSLPRVRVANTHDFSRPNGLRSKKDEPKKRKEKNDEYECI